MSVRDFKCKIRMDSIRYRVNVAFQRMSIRNRQDSLSFREHGLFGKYHYE